MNDLMHHYRAYATAMRLGDHSLARLAARDYNEELQRLGGPEKNPGERYLSMGMAKRPGEQYQVIWNQISDALSLEQYKKTMGLRTYKAKALLVRDHVSRSKKIHALCNKLIELIDANEAEVRESLKAVSNE